MRIKPIVVEVIEDDGMWFDESTYTYYSKDQLEPIEEPKGLDEASNKYGRDWYKKRMALSHKCTGCYAHIIDAFKAGAKWDSEQGVSIEQTVIGDSYGLLIPEIPIGKPFNLGDKVIVQIRKKL